MEGNIRFGPRSTVAPDNFRDYGNNKYWYMWDLIEYSDGFGSRWSQWQAAVIPRLRPYVLACVRALTPAPTDPGRTRFGCAGNLALGQPALQSSISPWSSPKDVREDALGAVDGLKRANRWAFGFHTDNAQE